MKAYELTTKGQQIRKDALGTQAALIYAELKKGPKTATEIADAVTKALETRQKPVLVVRHYLILFKNDGYVRFAKAEKRSGK